MRTLNKVFKSIVAVIYALVGVCIIASVGLFAVYSLFMYAPLPLALFILIMIIVGIAEIIKII